MSITFHTVSPTCVSKWLTPAAFVIWLGGKQQVTNVEIDSVPVLSSTVTTVDSARDLGVVLDSQLTMSAHVSSECRSAYHQLRQLTASATPNHPFVVTTLPRCWSKCL